MELFGYPIIYSNTTPHIIVLGDTRDRPNTIPMWYNGHPVIWLYFFYKGQQ